MLEQCQRDDEETALVDVGPLMRSDAARVCFFHTGPGLPHALLGDGPQHVGGAEVQLTLLGNELARRGWPVSFVVNDFGQPDTMATDLEVQLIKAARRPGGLPLVRFLTRTIPGCVRAFRQADPQICIQRGAQWHSALLARECRRNHARFIFWLAHDDHAYIGVPGKSDQRGLRRAAAFWGLKHADTVIAQTRTQQSIMKQLYGIECPIVPNLWPARDLPTHRARTPEVLWAARYDDFKRPHLVLDLARMLPDIKFIMAGGPVHGKERLFEDVRGAAEEIPNVEIMGFVPFTEIDKYFARSWAFLCTSSQEGFPNTFLQAWDHCTPVASTVDPDGVLTEHGIGVHSDNVEALAEAVSFLCGSSEGESMGRHGQAYLQQYHGTQRVITTLEAMLLDCLST